MGVYLTKRIEVEAMLFDEFIEYGKKHAKHLHEGMPWSFDIRGIPVSHENDDCYLLTLPNSPGDPTLRFNRGDVLIRCGDSWHTESKQTFDAAYELVADDAHVFQNPEFTVGFRTGLLAARELIASFVSTTHPHISESIRANWWPALGDDPGVPRQWNWDEVADEREDGSIGCKKMTPSFEALPHAYAFVHHAKAGTLSQAMAEAKALQQQ